MNNGILLWSQLKVIKTEWDNNRGCIDIHIPLRLNVPYDAMDDVPWIIREAIYGHLRRKNWPVEGIESLYFFYYENMYHLQLHTNKSETYKFYHDML